MGAPGAWALATIATAVGLWTSPDLPVPAFLPALLATLFVTGLQLLGALAGRGRPLPGAKHMDALRLALALLVTVLLLRDEPYADLWATCAVSFTVLIDICSRNGARVGVLPAVAAWLGLILLSSPRNDAADFLLPAAAGCCAIATWAAASIFGLDAGRLALVGVRPWAVPDLALLPFGVMAIGAASADLASATGLWHDPQAAIVVIALVGSGVIVCAALVLMLRYLDRRLRAAEQFAAERRATAEAAS